MAWIYIYACTIYIIELQLPLWLRWSSICLQCGRPEFDPWIGRIPWRREQLPKN